jgi:AcrR family transcriptional regulator
MSTNSGISERKIDSRVRRTRDSLGDALIDLMHEKPFDEITVQHVLDRAGVARSTFYKHYRDKDDLLISDVDEFFEMFSTLLSRRGEKSNRVVPVRELFAHVSESSELYKSMVAAGKIQDVLDLARGHFARGIEQRLAGSGTSSVGWSRTAAAHSLAGAFLSLLSWWLDRGMPTSPQQMDDLFHSLVWSGGVAAYSDPRLTSRCSVEGSTPGIPLTLRT